MFQEVLGTWELMFINNTLCFLKELRTELTVIHDILFVYLKS